MRNGASASGVTTQGDTVEAKFLARNGPSGWYSQAWMSRADQSLSRQKPAMCSRAAPIGIGLPSALPGPIQTPEFELVVEIAARAEVGLGRGLRLALAVRPPHRRARHADRRRAAVIGDRHVLVVRQQRIVRPQHPAGIGGVMDAGEEIGEVADPRRQVHRAIGRAREQQRLHAFDLAPLGAVGIEQLRQAAPAAPRAARRRARTARLSRGPPAASAARFASPENSPASLAILRSKISSPIATPPRGSLARLAVDAERQVLDREIRMAVGALDPAPAFGVMRCVDHQSPIVQRPSHITESCNNAPQMTPPG